MQIRCKINFYWNISAVFDEILEMWHVTLFLCQMEQFLRSERKHFFVIFDHKSSRNTLNLSLEIFRSITIYLLHKLPSIHSVRCQSLRQKVFDIIEPKWDLTICNRCEFMIHSCILLSHWKSRLERSYEFYWLRVINVFWLLTSDTRFVFYFQFST